MQKKKSKPKKTDASPPPNKKRKKGSQSAGGSCEFFKSSAISNLRDQSLLEVQDIEQLVQKGRQMNACPYYARWKSSRIEFLKRDVGEKYLFSRDSAPLFRKKWFALKLIA